MLEHVQAGEVLTELGRPCGENWKRTDGKDSRWPERGGGGGREKEARKTETGRTDREERDLKE